MAYCVQADVEIAAGGPGRLVAIADQNEDGTADGAVITRAIAEAQGWVDNHLRRINQRLNVFPEIPLPDPPADIIHITAQEAVFRLRSYRGEAGESERADHAERLALLQAFVAQTAAVTDDVRSEGPAIIARSSDEDISCDALKGWW